MRAGGTALVDPIGKISGTGSLPDEITRDSDAPLKAAQRGRRIA